METQNPYKVYVDVHARFDSSGIMLPDVIIWEDGSKYPVDRVIDIRPAAAAREIDIHCKSVASKATYSLNDRPI